MNFLQNATAGSRSSHVLELASACGGGVTRGDGGEGRKDRERHGGASRVRERRRVGILKIFYLVSGTASSGWCPTSAGCNASRFGSRSSCAATGPFHCEGERRRETEGERRDRERWRFVCIRARADLEPHSPCRLRVLTDQERARTTDGRETAATAAAGYHTSLIRAARQGETLGQLLARVRDNRRCVVVSSRARARARARFTLPDYQTLLRNSLLIGDSLSVTKGVNVWVIKVIEYD